MPRSRPSPALPGMISSRNSSRTRWFQQLPVKRLDALNIFCQSWWHVHVRWTRGRQDIQRPTLHRTDSFPQRAAHDPTFCLNEVGHWLGFPVTAPMMGNCWPYRSGPPIYLDPAHNAHGQDATASLLTLTFHHVLDNTVRGFPSSWWDRWRVLKLWHITWCLSLGVSGRGRRPSDPSHRLANFAREEDVLTPHGRAPPLSPTVLSPASERSRGLFRGCLSRNRFG